MSSIKQIEANRKNSEKSTGPKSIAGKMISSRNSTGRGFYSSNVLLPDEDREEFYRFARRMVAAYDPTNVLQEIEVKTIIETRWQLQRATRVDTELFRMYGFHENEQRGVGTAFANDASQANAFTKLTHYQAFLLKKLLAAEKELRRLKEAALALSFVPCHAVTCVSQPALCSEPSVPETTKPNESFAVRAGVPVANPEPESETANYEI